jgi:hypothetical protein
MKEKENRTADGNAGERKYLSTSNGNSCSLRRCLQNGESFQIPAAPTFSPAMGYERGLILLTLSWGGYLLQPWRSVTLSRDLVLPLQW